MDPYTSALNYLHNVNLGPRTTALDDLDLSFMPNAWSGAHLTNSDQPWPFVFLPGDRAWAKGINGKWRRVRILDAGQPENRENQFVLRYTASWTHEGVVFTKLFCPVEGNLKPDIPLVRRILFEEGVCFQSTRWQDEELEGQKHKQNMCLIA